MSKKVKLLGSENKRKEILDVINKTIAEEMDTVPITEENFLHECNLDSFGYAVFWISLWENIKIEFADELSNMKDKDMMFRLLYVAITRASTNIKVLLPTNEDTTLIDIQNNIENKLNISFEEAGNQILLEEDKNTWTTILEETKDIETENIDIDLIRQIMFKEKILKIQLKEANKLINL